MSLRFYRTERDIDGLTIPNGDYDDFETLKKVLAGHPNGIFHILVQNGLVQIKLNKHIESASNTGSINDPITVFRINRAEVIMGSQYGQIGLVVLLKLFPGGAASAISQEQSMRFLNQED